MTSTNDITTKNLRPDDAELSRLLWGGTHHDPHSILGAHEYDDHTVIRVLRPNALEVVALIGKERYTFTHVEDALFAVALPFTGLIDYRLEVSYPNGDGDPHVYTVADPTDSCRPSARSTCTCSPRVATSDFGRRWARIRAPTARPTAPSPACPSPCGHQMPRESA